MGPLVTKAPGKVLEWGAHMLGYLHSTVDYELCYTQQVFEAPSIESEATKLPSVRVFSDASHGPQGGRGQQGLLVTYNGAPVQWESRQQPFATLSSAESELMGYVDGVVMGESVAAIVNVLEDHKLHLEGEQVLCGDSQTGLKILVAPDGPWRTRHLRLRAYVVKERIQQQCWRTLHVPGTELPSDLLTKPIVNPASWQKFFHFLGARVSSGIGQKDEHQSVCSRLQAVVAGILGMAVWNPIHEAHKIACCLTITALVAYLASKAQDLKKIIGHLPAESQAEAPRGRDSVEKRSVREDEPTALGGEKNTRSVREDEPTAGLGGRAGDISLKGSRAAVFEPRSHGCGVRLAAMRAEPSTESGTWTVAGPHEWPQFRLPPQGRDRWGCAMAGGFDIMSNQEKGHSILYVGRRHSTRLKSAVDGLLWYGCMARSRWWRMTGAVAPGLWFRRRSSGWATVFSVTTHLNLRCLNMPLWIHKRALQLRLARRREAPRHRRHLDSRFRPRRSVRHRGLRRFDQKRSY